MSRFRRKKKPKERTFERTIRRLTPFSIVFMAFVIVGMWVLIWFAVNADENGNVTYPKWFVVLPWCLLWGVIIFAAGMILYVWRDRARHIITHGWHTTMGAYHILFETKEILGEVVDEKTDKKKTVVMEPSFTGIALGGTADEDMFVLTKPRKILVVPTAHINDYNAGGLAIDAHTDETPFEELPAPVKSAIMQCGGRVRFDPEVDKVEFSRDFCPPRNKGVVRSYQNYDLALRQSHAKEKSLLGMIAEQELTIRGLRRERRLEVDYRIGGMVGPNQGDKVSSGLDTRGKS